jgi:hypothetical protein
VGWFVVMPFAYFSGFGAFVLMLFGRQRAELPHAQHAPVAAAGASVAPEPPTIPAATP